MLRKLFHIPLTIILIVGFNSMAYAGAKPQLLDYLIQDVCVNNSDQPIAGDPASCVTHRDVKIGEKIPYLVTDFDKNNGNSTYFSFSSFPVLGMDGTVKIMTSKSGQGNFDSNYYFSFIPSRDGYDLADTTNSDFVSFIRTSDGGCYDQIWSHNGSAATMADRAGGWILFPFSGTPATWAQPSSAFVTTYHVQITPGISGCGNGNSAGVTYWNSPANYQFETGKVLSAIRSDHFASSALGSTNNALERYYYTREYGMTRWEAWIPLSRCNSTYGANSPRCTSWDAANYELQGRCSVMNVSSTGVPGLDMWGGQYWVRTDCRDETNYIPLNTPQLMLDNTMGQNDGYVDIDLAAVLNPAPLGFWNASRPQSYHGSGSANGIGWEIAANGGQFSNLTYGPYIAGLPAGHLNATFTLKVDNNNADNNPIVSIDVFRGSDNVFLAQRTITRREFNEAGVLQRFALPFNYDGQGQLEFRVSVYGNSYVYHASSEVGY